MGPRRRPKELGGRGAVHAAFRPGLINSVCTEVAGVGAAGTVTAEGVAKITADVAAIAAAAERAD